MNFFWPLVRHYYMALGMVDVSRQSIAAVLRGKGNLLAIVVGGAKEALEASPGVADLVLADRTGFVRCAIRAGADLVPVFAFGENGLFGPQIVSRWLQKVQHFFLKLVGVAPPLCETVFPRREPVNVVVGKPIPVRKVKNPSDRYVNEIHAKYMASLQQLYARNVGKYGGKHDKNNNNNNNNNKNGKKHKKNKHVNKKIRFLHSRCSYGVCGGACRCC